MNNMRISREDVSRKAISKRVRLTEARVRALKCPAGKDRVYILDEHTPGLAVCITHTGNRSFYLVKKILGRATRFRLGGAEISVEHARILATKNSAKIADGHNPQEVRRLQRGELMFKDLFEYFIEKHSKPRKRTWKADVATRDLYLTSLLGRRLSSITQADIRELHSKIGRDHGPYSANRLLALLSRMFVISGELGVNLQNPCKGVRRFKELSRDRFLQPEEMPRFFEALEGEPNDTMVDFFKMLLWTGARRANVLAMRWDEMNLDTATWNIPADKSKNAEPLTVHLPEPALDILNERQARVKGEWVFPARHGKSGHLSDPQAAWASLLQRARIKNLRIHDLRRTFGSWMAAGGASLPMIGRALGHKSVATTAIYARLNIEPVRAKVNAAVASMTIAASARPAVRYEPTASSK